MALAPTVEYLGNVGFLYDFPVISQTALVNKILRKRLTIKHYRFRGDWETTSTMG